MYSLILKVALCCHFAFFEVPQVWMTVLMVIYSCTLRRLIESTWVSFTFVSLIINTDISISADIYTKIGNNMIYWEKLNKCVNSDIQPPHTVIVEWIIFNIHTFPPLRRFESGSLYQTIHYSRSPLMSLYFINRQHNVQNFWRNYYSAVDS